MSGSLQLPATAEVKCGRAAPSAWPTGRENVSRTGSSGEIGAPAAGLASTTGSREAGNQVTRTGSPRRSHGRTALATSSVPDGACCPSETTRCPPTETTFPPKETRSTGSAKRSSSAACAATVGHRS